MNMVYISGKITGTTDYMERFAAAEKALTEKGYSVANPAKVCAMLPEDTAYEDYLKLGIAMLDMCDSIYLLRGWKYSDGAKLEKDYALTMGKKILRERED